MASLSITARTVSAPEQAKTQALVLLLPERKTLHQVAKALDAQLGGTIRRSIQLGDFSGKAGSQLWLPGSRNAQRVLLIGCGDPHAMTAATAKKIGEVTAKALVSSLAADAVITLHTLAAKVAAPDTLMEQLCLQLTLAHYQYSHTLNKCKKPPRTLKRVTLTAGGTLSLGEAKAAVRVGVATGQGANLTRELVNLPGNICTPKYLAGEARRLARGHKRLSTSVLDERKMAELGMHSLLSVGNGSEQPSQLIVMKYRGATAKERPYCLVGKGITFDTGGISLKPGAKMDEMKFDMGGAGSVFGALHAAALMELPINIVGVIAAAENMPSGRATKPGDVFTSMSGKTIEILNTDAEGRLVLCDALTYVERFSPVEVVDIATLTGAIIVALGQEATGIFSNDDRLADSLLAAGERSHDRGWRFPIWDEYHKQLDSQFADLANIGTGGAGSITAACFLSQFAESYKWAHLDIAGTAFRGVPKGGTGRPVPLLVQYLRERAGVL
ncbi:MAG: leucyl aminopeptidase [Halieaceae bacterium]|nr:leucyl aminopeptidase [Halieaceae bacterium]